MNELLRHNYYKKLLKLYEQGKLRAPNLTLLDIYHDEWCAINRGDSHLVIDVSPHARRWSVLTIAAQAR